VGVGDGSKTGGDGVAGIRVGEGKGVGMKTVGSGTGVKTGVSAGGVGVAETVAEGTGVAITVGYGVAEGGRAVGAGAVRQAATSARIRAAASQRVRLLNSTALQRFRRQFHF